MTLPQLMDARMLRDELGIKRGAADAIMRSLPKLTPRGLSRVYVQRRDVERLLAESTTVPSGTVGGRVGSATITTRKTAKGERRYVVRFRRGGRGFPVEHAGSFGVYREAKARRDFVAGELAAGRDPLEALAEVANPTRRPTLGQQFDAFIASRVDVADKTLGLYRNAKATLGALAERDPASLTPADFQTWVGTVSHLKPRTIDHYRSSIRQVLDFAGIEPNPARSKRVKLPSEATPEISPPSNSEWQKIAANLMRRSLLPARLMEALGLRISEAAELTYGDIDFAESRLRISRARTKRRTAGQRWLPVPAELLDEIAALCPLEDRSRERRVFSVGVNQIGYDIARACRDAGIAHYHPHDLRHRRVSLWVAHGFDPITIKNWAGHSKASMSLDVYSHVVVDPNGDEWREFWNGAYDQARKPKRELREVER